MLTKLSLASTTASMFDAARSFSTCIIHSTTRRKQLPSLQGEGSGVGSVILLLSEKNTDPAPAYGHPAPTWAGRGWRIGRYEMCLERSEKYRLDILGITHGNNIITHGNNSVTHDDIFITHDDIFITHGNNFVTHLVSMVKKRVVVIKWAFSRFKC